MVNDIITLKEVKTNEWALIAPKGHKIGPIFRGNEYKAYEWAKAYISGFYSWSLKREGEILNKGEYMNKKVEFFHKLFKLLQCRQDILEYLAEEKVIPEVAVQDILHQQHQTHASQIATILENALKEERLQLVSYEWNVLPNEQLCLTIVSDNNKKEFKYGF